MQYNTLFKYAGIGAIILLLVGLLGWYLFLRNQTLNTESMDAARGFDIAVPSFTGSRGSTAENIGAGLGAESILAASQPGRPPRLWKVSTTPVAGAGFLAGSTTLRFVERATGHIVDVHPQSGTIVRRTNELVPRVYEADVAGDGSVAFQFFHEGLLTTMLGRLGTTTPEGFFKLVSTDLGTPVRALAASPTYPEISFIVATGTMSHLIRSRSDGASPQRLLSLGVGGFDISALPDRAIFLTERPASGVLGRAYEVVNGTLLPRVSALGLMFLPRASSTAVIYSEDSSSRVRLFVQPTRTAPVSELTLPTLAQKCVWMPEVRRVGTTSPAAPTLTAYCASPQTAPGANFVDSWLRGAVHTSDAWFRIDASAALAEKFFTPESTVALDVEDPIMDSSGSFISFMNARDKSLWMLRIAE